MDLYDSDTAETIETSGLKAFTQEDAEDKTACADCVAHEDCAILDYVNKLSQKRDSKKVDSEFKCNIFVEKE